MKKIKQVITLAVFAVFITSKAYTQSYKVKYISYKSELKNELEGNTLAMYKYKNSTLSIVNGGKELAIGGTKDAVIIRLFQKLPFNTTNKVYANGFHLEDKEEKTSYYVQASISKDLRIATLRIINRNEIANKLIDDVIIVYNRAK